MPYNGPGNTEMLFWDTQAIQRPVGAQVHECRSVPIAIFRTGPPPTGRPRSESPRTNASSAPSGDQSAAVTMLVELGAISGCDEPPRAGAIQAPPRVR